jgi:predicted SPOUT superfamily RNA methylase MTH1
VLTVTTCTHFLHARSLASSYYSGACSIDNDETTELPGSEAHALFDMWVNTCPTQGSRTIRTEEAVLISLARLQPAIQRSVGSLSSGSIAASSSSSSAAAPH